MIVLRVTGGLGNQMFQYAAALALACHHAQKLFVYADAMDRPYQLDKFKITAERIAAIPTGVTRYSEPHFHFDPKFFEMPPPPVFLEGYFQSEHYFAAAADTVREQFQPVSPLSPNATIVAEAIARAPLAVSVHVRRGDFAQNPDVTRIHGVLDADHYRYAIELMHRIAGENLTFFVFSDAPEEAGRLIEPLVPGAVFLRGNQTWEDLILMSRCRHHILANSSFSWWGAWLKPDADKIVIAPRHWVTPEAMRELNICDLLPPSWILI